MGFSADMPVDRAYRDSRINRIFEGTNEINRLIVAETAIKEAQKGKYDLFTHSKQVLNEIDSLPENVLNGGESYFEEKHVYTKNFKKATMLVIQSLMDTLKRKLFAEQEIMMNISDMIIHTYVAESSVLRVEKLSQIKGEENIALNKDIIDVAVYDAADRIRKFAKDIIGSFAEAEQGAKLMKAIEHFTSVAAVNVKDARRRIANFTIEENKYKF